MRENRFKSGPSREYGAACRACRSSTQARRGTCTQSRISRHTVRLRGPISSRRGRDTMAVTVTQSLHQHEHAINTGTDTSMAPGACGTVSCEAKKYGRNGSTSKPESRIPGGLEPGVDFGGAPDVPLSDRTHCDLVRGQPERPAARRVLAQDCEEPLKRPYGKRGLCGRPSAEIRSAARFLVENRVVIRGKNLQATEQCRQASPRPKRPNPQKNPPKKTASLMRPPIHSYVLKFNPHY